MSKQIAYVAIDNGMEGRSPDTIMYASFDEDNLAILHQKDKSRAWRRKSEQIVDIEAARKKALGKLDGIDRLVLDLPNWLEEK